MNGLDRTRHVLRRYDIGRVKNITRLPDGYGSVCYRIDAETGSFIGKRIEQNGMNHPENEAMILDVLRNAGIPVSELIRAKNGESILALDEECFHLQRRIEGRAGTCNIASPWLLSEMAVLLGKIQKELKKVPALPQGISQGFFDGMTPERAIRQQAQTRQRAEETGDAEIARAVSRKICLLESLRVEYPDLSRMTCLNSHGDYKIQQLIIGENKVNAVIDFTSACIHPVCWEVFRSYLSADPACREGDIVPENLKRYLDQFLTFGELNPYDLKMMPDLYYIQILVSDYFGQYYASRHPNRGEILQDAWLLFKQCRFLSENLPAMEDALKAGF